MATYIGSNDRETLLGVVEEIDRLISKESYIIDHTQKPRTRDKAVYGRGILIGLKATMELALQNGPTPDLSKLRARMEPHVLERLLEDEAQRLSGLLHGLDYDIREVEDGRGPTMYAYAVGGIQGPKNYLDRVTALTALVDRLGTILSEQPATLDGPLPVPTRLQEAARSN